MGKRMSKKEKKEKERTNIKYRAFGAAVALLYGLLGYPTIETWLDLFALKGGSNYYYQFPPDIGMFFVFLLIHTLITVGSIVIAIDCLKKWIGK